MSIQSDALPKAPNPVGNYVASHQVGNLIYTSGLLPLKDGQLASTGAIGGGEVSMEQAQEAARHCALNALALLQQELGSLDKVKHIVKITGFINASPDFTEHASVMNGASDTLVKWLGERGKHTRSAVGVASLPLGATVEMEVIAAI